MEINAKIVKLYDNGRGLPISDLVDRFKRSRAIIKRILVNAGVPADVITAKRRCSTMVVDAIPRVGNKKPMRQDP